MADTQDPGADLVAIRAVFMRGGASKAVMFHRRDLPDDQAAWAPIFASALGSPDPYGRQLNGMGGGISSLSKVIVVGPPTHPEADVDFTFGQVEIGRDQVDYSGNCGSMSAAIGPFAVDEGMVAAPAGGEAVVRIHNTNTRRLIRARFAVRGGRAAVSGAFGVDGIGGTGAEIRLDFLDPGGANTGRLLPTGQVRDEIDVPEVGRIAYSFVDASNPVMFVDADSLGMTGAELPDEIAGEAGLLDRIDLCRRAVTVSYGAAPDMESARRVSLPRIAIVAAPREALTLSGRRLGPSDCDIMVRMIARGVPNKTVPITTAICLRTACGIPGTIPAGLAATVNGPLRIGHPSGVWSLDAAFDGSGPVPQVRCVSVSQTARRLFQGEVLVSRDALVRTG